MAFKSWLLKSEKVNDAIIKKHPLLAGDFTGSVAIIPDSVQTRLQNALHVPFVKGHTTTSTRIKWADKEMKKRSAHSGFIEVPPQPVEPQHQAPSNHPLGALLNDNGMTNLLASVGVAGGMTVQDHSPSAIPGARKGMQPDSPG